MSANQSVPVETVGVGDLVCLTFKRGDTTVTVRGKIGVIEPYGRTRIIYSECGIEMGRYTIEKPRELTAVILERYTPAQPMLFDDHVRRRCTPYGDTNE